MKSLRQRVPDREPASERLRLFVVEAGATGPVGGRADEYDETTAITQMDAEQPLAFAQRVLARLAAAERFERRFQAAVILIGHRGDIGSTAARRLIALGLAAHGQTESGRFELSFEANLGPTEHARDELLGLVEELTLAGKPSGLPIKLRFNSASPTQRPPSSGIFWKAPPSR